MVSALATGWKAKARKDHGIILYRVVVDRESWKPTLEVAGRKNGTKKIVKVAVDPDVLSSEIATERAACLVWDTGSPREDPLRFLQAQVD